MEEAGVTDGFGKVLGEQVGVDVVEVFVESLVLVFAAAGEGFEKGEFVEWWLVCR